MFNYIEKNFSLVANFSQLRTLSISGNSCKPPDFFPQLHLQHMSHTTLKAIFKLYATSYGVYTNRKLKKHHLATF